jgi:hypothetical protein
MLPISTGVVPLFVTVTGCGMPARENVNEEGDSVTGPPDKANPAPVKGIVIEEFTAELSIAKEAFRGPTAEGVTSLGPHTLLLQANLDLPDSSERTP